MTPAALLALADRVEAASIDRHKLKFGLWPTGGQCLTTSRQIAALLCDLWNARADIAAALRARAAIAERQEAGE